MYAIEQILSFLKKDEDVDSKKGVVERGAFAALDKSSGGLLSLPSNLSKLFFQKTNTTKGE